MRANAPLFLQCGGQLLLAGVSCKRSYVRSMQGHILSYTVKHI
jgi:hypothetical protein